MGDEKERLDRIWERFVLLSAVRSFGEKAVLEGVKQRNFMGSVDSHKELFDQAASDVTGRTP